MVVLKRHGALASFFLSVKQIRIESLVSPDTSAIQVRRPGIRTRWLRAGSIACGVDATMILTQ